VKFSSRILKKNQIKNEKFDKNTTPHVKNEDMAPQMKKKSDMGAAYEKVTKDTVLHKKSDMDTTKKSDTGAAN